MDVSGKLDRASGACSAPVTYHSSPITQLLFADDIGEKLERRGRKRAHVGDAVAAARLDLEGALYRAGHHDKADSGRIPVPVAGRPCRPALANCPRRAAP